MRSVNNSDITVNLEKELNIGTMQQPNTDLNI